jgi:hypothetical protein
VASLALVSALLGAMPCASAQDLGRIFFTPQQRQDLDRRRNLNVTESEVIVESLVTVNGHVARSSGKSTTWINGVWYTRTAATPDRVTSNAATPRSGVKIGQTLIAARARSAIRSGRDDQDPSAGAPGVPDSTPFERQSPHDHQPGPQLQGAAAAGRSALSLIIPPLRRAGRPEPATRTCTGSDDVTARCARQRKD